jgi:NAD(P)-dependent dehydrogenase (short-subunit alcohol dehydrogenase family)
VVGSGIIRAFLAAGATVVAPLRGDPAKTLLPELEGIDTAKLDVIKADVSDPKQVANLAQDVKQKYGSLDHVVASVGGWWQKGPLLQQSVEELEENLRVRVVSHFCLAKYLIPVLRQSAESYYIFITGAAGERVFMLDASMLTACTAAQYGITMCAMAEISDKPGPRILEDRIAVMVKRNSEVKSGTEIMGIPVYSNWEVGKLVMDVASSNKRSEVVRIDADMLKHVH